MGYQLTFLEKVLILKALDYYVTRRDITFNERKKVIELYEKVREWK